MRIFYIARFDSSGGSADSRHVFEFCRQFGRRGHSVTLFLPDWGHRPSVEGFSIVFVPILIRNPAFTYFFFYFVLFFYFLFYAARGRPEVVYTRHQPMEWMVTGLKSVFRFVYVIEVNGLAPVELRISGKPPWTIAWTRFWERRVFRMPHLLVTPSQLIRDRLCEQYGLDPDRFLVVSNGADPERFRPMDPVECRRKLGLDPEGPYLAFVGAFRKWHGISRLVEVLPELVETVPGVRVLLVGDGEEKTAIEQTVAQHGLETRVLRVGKKPVEEVPLYINAADVCLAPYFDARLNETGISPLKIFEYFACGKPVVTSPLGGLDELLRPRQIGILVESDAPADWVPVLKDLLENPDLRKRLGAQARDAVLREFSWQSICQKIETRLEALRKKP